jgi:hypothetical protein
MVGHIRVSAVGDTDILKAENAVKAIIGIRPVIAGFRSGIGSLQFFYQAAFQIWETGS